MDRISSHNSRDPGSPHAAERQGLDLLYVSGPQVARLLSEQVLTRLEDKGLAIDTYGVHEKSLRNKLLKRLIDERLGLNGHVVFGGHGKVPENPRNRFQREQKHLLQLGHDRFGELPTRTLVNWIHKPNISGAWSGRTAHLLACNAEAIIAGIPPGSDTWKGGYTIIYGTGSMGASSSTAPSVEAALDYVADCHRNDKTPHPLAAFARAGLARVEGLTVIGGELEGPVRFNAPCSMDDLANQDLDEILDGSPRDVMRVRVALALDGAEDFHPDPAVRIPAYLFARVLNGDVNAVQEVLKSKPAMIDAVDANGYSLLHLAVDAGKAQVARFLINQGAQLEHALNADRTTPLMMAAVAGHEDIVKLLLDKGADPDLRRGGTGPTAAELAHANDEPEIAKLLLAEASKRRQRE